MLERPPIEATFTRAPRKIVPSNERCESEREILIRGRDDGSAGFFDADKRLVSVSDTLRSTRSAAVFILAARKSSTIARAFRSAASRLSWAWMALSIWLTSRTLVVGTWLKTFR